MSEEQVRDMTVEEFSAEAARAAMGLALARASARTIGIVSVEEEEEPKRGFFGIGRRPGIYRVRIVCTSPKTCSHYRRTYQNLYQCTYGGPGSPDPSRIMGWDRDLCKIWGGFGCSFRDYWPESLWQGRY